MKFVRSIVLILQINLVNAQPPWTFEILDIEDGLSSNTVNCVFEDSRGYTWIGSFEGLDRYDAYTVTSFNSQSKELEELLGQNITSIAEDSFGEIWIGTRGAGIFIYSWELGAFRQLGPEHDLPEGRILFIKPTADGRMLVSINKVGLGLYDFDKEKFTLHKPDPRNPVAISSSVVLSAVQENENEFWLGANGNTVELFNVQSGNAQIFSFDDSPDEQTGMHKPLLKAKDGDLWIGTSGKGLYRFDINAKRFTRYDAASSSLSSNLITTLYEDATGTLYIGTDGGGISVLDFQRQDWSYINYSPSPGALNSNAVYDIYKDSEGRIWISTVRGGINIYSPYKTKFGLLKPIPYESKSIGSPSVTDVIQAENGLIWLCTDGGGVDVIDLNSGVFEHFRHDPKNPSSTISTNAVISLGEDANGNIWAGTFSGGVNRINPRSGEIKQFLPDPGNPGSINSKNVWSIYLDASNDLWFGLLGGGLDKFIPSSNRFKHYKPSQSKNSISGSRVMVLLEDSRNNFWIGTGSKGLDLLDRKTDTFTNYQHKKGDSSTLLSNKVRTLFEDNANRLWIGTTRGVNIMDLNTLEVSVHKVNRLLPDININGIQQDQEGNYWIATKKGLSRYREDSNETTNFTKANGLQGSDFNYTASITATDGTMYFGGTNGLNFFDPSKVEVSPIVPSVVITDIKLFDKSVSGLKSAEGERLIKSSIHALKEITFQYKENAIEINFSSLDYTDPTANKYRYQLEGFDQDWVYTDALQRSASYTNLDPGKYNFMVQGTNSDGIWSTKTRALSLTILPPWWQTWWFRILAFLLIGATATVIIKWRMRLLKKQKESLRSQVAAATAQVNDQNSALRVEQEALAVAISDTNMVVSQAVESGIFSSRIDLEGKEGAWHELALSINHLFDSIVLPFENITEIVGAMASSNLSVRYQHEAKGEVLKMTSSLNVALDNLSDLIATIQQTTMVVSKLSEDMDVSSNEMAVGTSEIATSTAELSNGAQEQVTRIDQASSELEVIQQVSSSVGEQAQSINEAAKQGLVLSNDGSAQMESMDTRMQEMERASTETSESIELLLAKSKEINAILNSIRDISVETNMLALNATIEAAKAGESGRGFAVVADQIRKLAENSNTFTTEIEQIVQELQNAISAVNNRITEMNDDITNGVKAARTASNSFSELASSNSETFDLSEKIVGLTSKQTTKVSEVTKLMESVVVIAEQAATGTEQIASSSNELSAGMTEYQDKTKKVGQIIRMLNEKIGQFRLE
ncbi:MAG: two-component regulator propeller domain-containing protein [Bacteroidota bacterium]